MQRVAVIGCGGAGKSTLARFLGRRLGLPGVHLDENYWQPGWRRTDPLAWRRSQERLIGAEAWVIDGNYLSTLELRLSAVDTIVFVDLPAWLSAWRATRRVLTGYGRANTAAGCPERLDRRHLRFLRYIWRFPQNAREHLLHALEEHESEGLRPKVIVRLRTPAQVRRFLAEVAI